MTEQTGGLITTISRNARHARISGILMIIAGALTVVAGVLTLQQPITAVASLTLLLVAYFVVAGIIETFGAFSARPAAEIRK